ncbi:MAG: hypothetical protein WBN66_06270 [Smithella sp.]
MKNQIKEKEDHGKSQAKAQIASIVEMVNNLDNSDYAAENGEYSAQETIQNDPLSVEVRNGWHSVGSTNPPDEFCILLCWGGPACRIIGDLDEHAQPEKPRLEYQDWGTNWTEYPLTEEEEAALQTYCEQFYFEG